MSKFSKHDWVRVTDPESSFFDEIGQVTESSGCGDTPVSAVYFHGSGLKILFGDSALTLADPEPHAVPPALNRRAEVLRTAESLVNGDRADDYGPPATNFRRIADLWAPIIGAPITPEQVALCMAQVKIARLITTPNHEDSWIDICGYAALGAEIAAGGDGA